MHKIFQVTPENVTFEGSVVYSDSVINSYDVFTLYEAHEYDTWIYPITQKESPVLVAPRDSKFSVTLNQAQTTRSTKSIRYNIYTIMRDWGGIFGFTRMMTVLTIGRM